MGGGTDNGGSSAADEAHGVGHYRLNTSESRIGERQKLSADDEGEDERASSVCRE